MNTTNRFSQESLSASQENSDVLGYDVKQENISKTQRSKTNRNKTNKTQTHNTQDDTNHTHAHIHSEESLRRIVNRLSRIEGHVRGIKTMVQQSSPCPDVLLQIAAVRGALDRVARIVLDEHLTECIARAVDEGNIEVEINELKAALDRFLP
ncbi:metal-sensitive transcriptional regulator [Mastigocoleus sp. MO_188.B34]|uniref:metal-sensitive transcriptional regulator n=1 Tax=Mastigocoleus sp. MO_188.B34 TaxID=3036635 RepID=UPI00262A0AF0|nr:metal-sensitive transcriptional regulator [Mastigocoleus sp. MO_188.B34]MDJ0695727.1 metal-sensitive transcriptional regulator [Mastigocoleus sp. MO_188.B34]